MKSSSKKEKVGEEKPAEEAVEEDSVDGSEIHKMVQYELEPEVISQTAGQNTESSVKQRKTKKEKQKPILLNKDEKPLVKVCVDLIYGSHFGGWGVGVGGYTTTYIRQQKQQLSIDIHNLKSSLLMTIESVHKVVLE